MGLQIGMTGRSSRVVTEAMTAIALGSGDVPVFGTPALLALIEEACVGTVSPALPDGSTSVGAWVELEHLAPSMVGAVVEAFATLDGIDGRKVSFTIEALEGDHVIARAKHRRVIVERARFASG